MAIFRNPALIAAATIIGLLAALLGDHLWVTASWLALSVPILVVARFACFGQRSSR
jgi:hypothetical protein